MPHEESLGRISQLRYKGVFDFEQLYRLMRAWFAERQYEFFEVKYKDKDKTMGHELEITWKADRKINDFCRNDIKMFIHCWDMNEMEVVKDGKKKKVFKGRMMITFDASLTLDYQGLWDGSKLQRFLRELYIKHIIWHEIDDVWGDKLWYEVNKLQQLVKRFLDMEAHSDVYDDMW
ncbi:hypothetical protein HYS47_02305 [Candidatus Woesearchaeota archaeon]|nr:hypothetical protein [Candidatus Woesearchaeota archaeon]